MAYGNPEVQCRIPKGSSVIPTTAWRVPSDWGVCLRIWRLPANILNKQSWKTDQGWSSTLGVWREANNLTL